MNKENKGCLITLAVIIIIGIFSALVTDIYTGFGIFIGLLFISGLVLLIVVGAGNNDDMMDWMLHGRKPKR